LTDDAPESPDLASLIHEMARSYHFLGDLSQAESLCYQALEMASCVSAKRVEADALITLGVLRSVNTENAIAALNEAIAICQAEKLPVEESRAHMNLGASLGIFKANLRAGQEHFHRAAEIARQLGDHNIELLSLTFAAFISIRMGEFSKVEQIIAHLHEIRDQLVNPGTPGQNYQALQAYIKHATGNLEGAAECSRIMFRQAIDSGSAYEIIDISLSLCPLLVELGMLDEANVTIQHGLEAAEQVRDGRVRTRAVWAIVLARTGDFVQARQVYDKAEQIFAEHSRAWSGIFLSMAHADVLAAEKRWAESFAAFQESADLLVYAEMRFDRSIFLQDWAQARLQRGQPEDLERARELYNEALAEFEDMGSPGYVVRIQARLDELPE
jgi:tetratricopeptide (TPR) repeat protein